MQITCPNCQATYEVPAEMIPAEGREVKCSTCDHSWNAHPVASVETPNPAPETEPSAATIEPQGGEQSPATSPATQDAATVPPAPPTVPPSARGEISPEQAAEAFKNPTVSEDELKAMMFKDGNVPPALNREPLPNEGELADELYVSDAVEKLSHEAKAEDTENAAEGAVTTVGNEGQLDANHTPPPKRSGFMSGFIFTICLVGLLFALYYLSPQIIESFPATEPYLNSFNNGMLKLFEVLVGWIEYLETLIP